jgi:hypothetical protein
MDKVYGVYKDHLIIETKYHWGYEVVAIHDHEETIRKKLIGYNLKERVQIIQDAIKERLTA